MEMLQNVALFPKSFLVFTQHAFGILSNNNNKMYTPIGRGFMGFSRRHVLHSAAEAVLMGTVRPCVEAVAMTLVWKRWTLLNESV